MKIPLILKTDGYKLGHWRQYPPGTTRVFSYLESRGGEYSETLFFGLQGIIKEHLLEPITMEQVEYCKKRTDLYSVKFHYEGWKRLVEKHNGLLPLKIRAVKEGSLIPVKNVLLTIENTDPEFFWLTNYVEDVLMRIWYPITVATLSKCAKNIMEEFMLKTEGTIDGVEYMLHDFGARGVSSSESAQIGGAAHLVNFKGTDTLEALEYLTQNYNIEMAGTSINASEHSTITSWGREGEFQAYENMVEVYKEEPMFACVSDSWDIMGSIGMWGKLKKKLSDYGTKLIVRPDSGDPVAMSLAVVDKMSEEFGITLSPKGYVRIDGAGVIYGDGIDSPRVIRNIFQNLADHGYSAANMANGMGGGLLQKVNRDTNKFALKCSLITVNGKDREIYKDPISDHGKKSKKGYIDLTRDIKGNYVTTESPIYGENSGSELQTVFLNGKLLIDEKFETIRARANGRG